MSLDPTQDAIDRNPLPTSYVKLPPAIAIWIDNVVPCLVTGATQSQAITDMVVAHLRRRGVSDDNIVAALDKSASKFSYMSSITFNLQIKVRNYTPPPPDGHQTYNNPEPADPVKEGWRATDLEIKYRVARDQADIKTMEHIGLLFLALYNAGRAWARTKQDKERIEEVGAEMVRNAPNIARVIRPSGPPEPPAPGPDGRTPRLVDAELLIYVLDRDELQREAAEAEAENEDADAE